MRLSGREEDRAQDHQGADQVNCNYSGLGCFDLRSMYPCLSCLHRVVKRSQPADDGRGMILSAAEQRDYNPCLARFCCRPLLAFYRCKARPKLLSASDAKLLSC